MWSTSIVLILAFAVNITAFRRNVQGQLDSLEERYDTDYMRIRDDFRNLWNYIDSIDTCCANVTAAIEPTKQISQSHSEDYEAFIATVKKHMLMTKTGLKDEKSFVRDTIGNHRKTIDEYQAENTKFVGKLSKQHEGRIKEFMDLFLEALKKTAVEQQRLQDRVNILQTDVNSIKSSLSEILPAMLQVVEHQEFNSRPKPVCPLPAALNGSRTIGSVNMVTCNLGYTGGGIATCQSNLQWTDTVLACETILNHDCVEDTLCLEIDATCIDSVCSCGDARIYNANTHTCEMACPSGWLWNYQSCYYFDSTDRKTFDGAKASCHGMGATLVEVNDEMENTFLASQSMLTSTGFRMALTDIVNEGIWIWDESQTSAVYLNWGYNEPNNGGNDEHCSKFGSTGAWHDIRCYDAREYLCELNL